MKNKKFLVILASAAFSIMSAQAHATIILHASNLTAAPVDGNNSNCEPGCIYDILNVNGGVNDGSLALLYKDDFTGGEEGAFADSYTTTYSGDPNDATIAHTLLASSISCPECYLAIKDGNHTPDYYFYDLFAWDGIETIQINGLWAGTQGAISHVSIWGREGGDTVTVPEPSAIALLGLGLLAVGWATRRRGNTIA